MNKIHNLSQITTLADFDIFSVPPTQLTIEKNIVTEHRPLSTLTETSTIEFSLGSAIDEYIHLRETMLYMKIRVNLTPATGATITAADWKKIQPVNNLLHSLFRTVDLEIEGKSINQAPQTYAYKAYFESMLGFTDEAKLGYLTAAGWFNDEVNKAAIDEDIDLFTPGTVAADGTGKSIELMGKLHLDLAFQPKALLGGTKLKFSLIPNPKDFYLWCDASVTPTIVFESAALYVTRSKLAYPVVEAHNMALTQTPAKYPMMRSNVKSFTVPTGSLDVNLDNAILGQIPRRMFLAMVDSKGVNGDLTQNPFRFQHFNLNYLTAAVDGIQYPSVAFTPDFTNGLYVREFLSVYDTLNQLTSDSCLSLTHENYSNGNVIFGFSFAPDPVDDCNKCGYVNPIRHGSVRLSLKFARALTANINVLIYCEYDNILQIDATRTPITDYI